MIGPDILADLRTRLAHKIAGRPAIPPCDPLSISPWIAMSLLQKAIRRGHTPLALQAAATLLIDSPDRLWRRCGGIAFEDMGIADLDTLGLVTAALGGKRVRQTLGGEWAVGSFIVTAMAEARKCRSADDLLMGVELHPDLAEARHKQAELSIHQLRRIVLSQATLPERALALWFVLGTDRRPSPRLATRRGEPAFAFDLLDELGCPMTMVEIAREGFRRTREMLSPLVGLLMAGGAPTNPAVTDDDLGHEAFIGALPCWALDTYTREGRRALSRFAAGESRTAKWVRDRIPEGRHTAFLGDLLFQVEGGLMRRRLRWALGDSLRRQNEVECRGVSPSEASEILALLSSDIPQLNEVRAEVMEDTRHAR
ncbi:hypothetical protein MKK68_18465 [Methylobacterium sp. E-016]|uniref:hypothetical protein n=1 Tax=Methylobacterium sp. E-016 TaxID=2836556 RepID=UPI001FBAE106|nr:hypothetical protein [Methylobacterium sp. E-016]MCJ2077610.1 hypothetical protein [Methylobacterium sp. E-016]